MKRLRVARLACLLLIATTLTTLPAAGAATVSHPGAADRASRKVAWHNTSYTDADSVRVSASGKVRGGKRKLQLQAKFPGGWRTFARGHSKKSGRFHVGGRLQWYGTHKVRIHAAGRHAFHRATKVHVNPSWTPRGSASGHKLIKDFGHPWLLDPCQVIRYQVNDSDVGPAGLDLAKLAMEQASWATGTRVKYAGKTKFVPFHRHGAVPKRGVDLVIAWAGTAAIKDFQGTTVGGVGGALRGWPGITRKGHRKVFRVQAAGVTLNTDQWVSGLQYPGWDGPTYTAGQVLLHEIGHAFGLEHVNSTDQLMYPSSSGAPDADGIFRARYGAGDLAGLQQVGLAGGCVRKAHWRPRTARFAPAPVPEAIPFTFRAG